MTPLGCKKPRPLLLGQRAGEEDLAVNPIEQTLLGVALGAIYRMDLRVLESHRHAL
jgi:hypothetical protein